MEFVVCYCLKCKAELGIFTNIWNGIGSTYFSPVHPPISSNGLVATGDVSQGAPGSQVENSVLQALACKRCREVMGLRCDNAPDVHLLKRNQLLLRLCLTYLVSQTTKAKIQPLILETFPLTLSSTKKVPEIRRGATVQPSVPRTPKSKEEFSRPQSVRPSSNNTLLSVLEEESQKDMTRFQDWARGAIESQQKDIDRIQGAVQRIEKDMSSFKDFMQDIRRELATSQESQQVSKEAKFALIRQEVNSLRTHQENEKEVSRRAKGADCVREDLRSVKAPLNELLQLTKDDPQMWQNIGEIQVLKDDLMGMKTSLQNLQNLTTELPSFHHKLTKTEAMEDEMKALKNGMQELRKLVRSGSKLQIESKQSAAIQEVLRLLNKRIDDEVTNRQSCLSAPDTSISAVVAAQAAQEEDRRQQGLPAHIGPLEPQIVNPECETQAVYASQDPDSPLPSLRSEELVAAGENERRASPMQIPAKNKWCYTGPDTRQAVWSACSALGTNSKRRSIQDSIRLLEDYVNKKSQQNTPQAKKYGKILPTEVGIGPVPDSLLQRKRPRDELKVGAGIHNAEEAFPIKRRRISTRTALPVQVPSSASKRVLNLHEGQSNSQNRPKISPILEDYGSLHSSHLTKAKIHAAVQPISARESLVTAVRRPGRLRKIRSQSNIASAPSADSAVETGSQYLISGRVILNSTFTSDLNNSFSVPASSFSASLVPDSQIMPVFTLPNTSNSAQEEEEEAGEAEEPGETEEVDETQEDIILPFIEKDHNFQIIIDIPRPDPHLQHTRYGKRREPVPASM